MIFSFNDQSIRNLNLLLESLKHTDFSLRHRHVKRNIKTSRKSEIERETSMKAKQNRKLKLPPISETKQMDKKSTTNSALVSAKSAKSNVKSLNHNSSKTNVKFDLYSANSDRTKVPEQAFNIDSFLRKKNMESLNEQFKFHLNIQKECFDQTKTEDLIVKIKEFLKRIIILIILSLLIAQ